jgi:hypothetical protein
LEDNVQRVIAKYQEDPSNEEANPYYQNPDWMGYLKEHNQKEPPKKVPSAVGELVKTLTKNKEVDEGFNINNPWDYKDPNSKPKEQKESPPTEKDIPTHPEVSKSDKYNEQGALKEWWDTRRKDYTQDPEEQSPAISIDRKYASAEDVLANYYFKNIPLLVEAGDFDNFEEYVKVAATLNDIVNKDTHYKNNEKMQRSKNCVVFLRNRSNKSEIQSGKFVFNVASAAGHVHTVVFQFYRDEGQKPNTYAECKVEIACSCPSFLFYGAQYYAVLGKYMYSPRFRRSLVPPTPQDQVSSYRGDRENPGRGLNFRVCKHILAAYTLMKTWPIEKHFEKYPLEGPPSAIMNVDEWKRIMKFEFSKKTIIDSLRTKPTKVPSVIRAKWNSKRLTNWIENIWVPRTDQQKIDILKTLVEHPEEVYFLALKEADIKGGVTPFFAKKVFEILDLTVKSKAKGKPITEKDPEVPAEQVETGKGTGDVLEQMAGAIKEKSEDKIEKQVEREVNKEVKKTKTPMPEETVQGIIDDVKSDIQEEITKGLGTDPGLKKPSQRLIDKYLNKITPTLVRRVLWKYLKQSGTQET